MAAILQQLSGNPLSTAIGQKIEQATDPSLTESDWTLNMEICDMINDTDEGPKDAIRAIKKRLQQNAGKNHTVVMYTLTILETCVKNCGKRFHLLVTNKDFIQDLFKIIGPKYDPPSAVQEKVLSLIQIWADTFRGQSEFSGVTQAYNELKQKGIEFPATSSEAVVPIHTPQRSVPVTQQTSRNIPTATVAGVNQQPPPRSVQKPHTPRHVMSGPLTLSAEQMTKLKGELDVVQGNIKVFNEMLNELTPGKEHKDDWELLCQLHNTCQAMQKRLVELIEKVANEEVTIDLLGINDEINSVFLRFEKFVRIRNQGKGVKEEREKHPEEPSLIDLTEDNATTGATSASDISIKISNLKFGSNGAASTNTVNSGATAAVSGDADFDVFAQSRSEKNSKSADNSELQREEDFNEMEQWLNSQSAQQANQTASTIPGTDFDRFLAERASAAERLPNNQQQTQQSKPKEDPFEF
ncbi:TOM1-like protein 2 isoform X1 [Leptotrombidium deliense]|uniref:TOM1-like protein 2 isoform X1 n=1 Tax=Leptotrombidium deliense TaxID=299467 RepID=A0A443S4Z6_9ACAR|nr:TOM1-like protein 2 isoform X1 [Leptotrombidium deliense]